MTLASPLICIVDDDLSVRRALGRLITSAGYAVATFGSARDFLTLAPSVRTACLVLDIYLDEMDVFELQARLAADLADIPIIFMTAHDDATTRERIERAGVAGVLGKPFDGERLLEAIRGVVDRGAGA